MADVTPKDLRKEGGFSTTDKRVVVKVSPEDLLKRGTHSVKLQVTDEAGHKGYAVVEIQVVDTLTPNARASILDIESLEKTEKVNVGIGFVLSAEGSFDPNGTPIVEYNWELKSPIPFGPEEP